MASPSPRAITESGDVAGAARRGHLAFLGIPYAAPPVGIRRFAAPALATPWAGVREATAYGASALQGESFASGAVWEGPIGEDCLFLNVYTPGLSGKRPVMVFIHGGAFIIGSSSMPLYDGGPLASSGDQVVVSFNYRLGALGYLTPGEHGERWGAVANAGSLDQLAALEWVKRNIEGFGGDPGNVTVFGESAGGTSVLNLIATPRAEGLFHRAIAQSPGVGLDVSEAASGRRMTGRLLAALGLRQGQEEQLRALSAAEILAAQAKVRGAGNEWFGSFPVLDALTVPKRPAELFAEGGGARVPLLIGTNRDEWNLFEPPVPANVPASRPADRLREAGFDLGSASRVDAIVQAYRESRRAHRLPHDDGAISRALLGDLRFRMPSVRFAEAHAARGLPTYMYLFTHGSPALRGALGACHALELPFVFGTLDRPMQDRFAGTGPRVEALSRTMMAAWTAFAQTGSPESEAAGELSWPAYDVKRRATRIFDLQLGLEDAPLDEERAAWDPVSLAVSSP